MIRDVLLRCSYSREFVNANLTEIHASKGTSSSARLYVLDLSFFYIIALKGFFSFSELESEGSFFYNY